MNRREINASYDKIITEAQRIVFDAIAEFCRKNRAECISNGPFGTQLTRYSDKYKPGYSFAYGKYSKELEIPKYLNELLDWYEQRFGQIPQAICKQGVWS